MKAIMTYHSIDPSGSVISVDEPTWRRHVEWYRSQHVQVVPLATLVTASAVDNAVAITFDDGFVNFRDCAWPLLKANGLPVTLFVPTDFVGAHNSWTASASVRVPSLPIMDWDSLGQLAADGVSIGSHTRRHPDLRTLSPTALHDEIGGAAEELNRKLGKKPIEFAYPFGFVNPTVESVVRDHHTLACSTELAILSERATPWRLPRLDAFYYRSPGHLERFGSSRFKSHLWIRSRARSLRHALGRSAALA